MFSINKENNHLKIKIFGIKFNFKVKNTGYAISGNDNKILLKAKDEIISLKNSEKVNGLNIIIVGDNNKIFLGDSHFNNCSIKLYCSNAKIEIGDNCKLDNLHVSTCCGNNQSLIIKKNTTSFYTEIYLNEDNATLEIGNDCMLSGSITFWPTDGHAIIDKISNNIINIPQKIRIGNHCWIGFGAHFCKNANLSDNIIVGARSVVTKNFDESNVIIAGNPAKVIKHNVEWRRDTATRVMKDCESHMAVERERVIPLFEIKTNIDLVA